MVWVVSDEAMEHMMGGDFTDVYNMYKTHKNISVRTLSGVQDTYKSYQGFRKFFRKHLQPIIGSVCYMDEKRCKTKIIKGIIGM